MTDFKSLPVYQHRQEILDALENNQVIIVESPTGSGKTTQIPIILKEAGYASKGIIGITQPRRIATLGVCSYIKSQVAAEGLPENYCAYKMRFYDTTDINTRIKILTDGMLLQELKADSDLSRYSVIMVDEAHERSLNIDFILGLLKQIAKRRPELKIIISSATLNTKIFSRFFEGAPIISIKARVYDVAIKYFPTRNTADASELSHSICTVLNQLLKRFKAGGYKDTQRHYAGDKRGRDYWPPQALLRISFPQGNIQHPSGNPRHYPCAPSWTGRIQHSAQDSQHQHHPSGKGYLRRDWLCPLCMPRQRRVGSQNLQGVQG